MSTHKINSTNVWSAWIENGKNITQILALGIAAIWSYYTFVEPELFRPDDYRPHLRLETKLESMRTLPDRTIVTLGIHVSNESKRFLRSLATHYELLGFSHSSNIQTINVGSIANALNSDLKTLKRWNLYDRTIIHRISIGRILPDRWQFAPGETYSNQIVAVVPCDANVLQMRLSSHYDHSNSELFRAEWTKKKGTLWYNTEGRVAAGSYPPAAPADPYVPNSGIRLFGQ